MKLPNRSALPAILAVLIILLILPAASYAKPGRISEIKRSQLAWYYAAKKNLMRIWIVYVGQGDGILIQLPERMAPESTPGDGIIDISIDGGDNSRFGNFLTRLYGDTIQPHMDYSIITHFDSDHFYGLHYLMDKGQATFGRIYHSGLAWFTHERWEDPGLPAIEDPDRLMAYVDDGKLPEGFFINNLADLRENFWEGGFHGRYNIFANHVVNMESPPTAFRRTMYSGNGRHDLERRISGLDDSLRLTVIWPADELYSYGGNSWSQTINGNSVAFHLKYDDFEMLFTGDLNHPSEDSLLSFLKARDREHLLECDVLKAPHHAAGGEHASHEFYKESKLKPVITVATMGSKGFKSKAISGNHAWQHPSDSVILWLGGSNRFYSTYVHEQTFLWHKITKPEELEDLVEISHILIETDGKYFRVVEIDVDPYEEIVIPHARDVKRGDGTLWISAE